MMIMERMGCSSLKVSPPKQGELLRRPLVPASRRTGITALAVRCRPRESGIVVRAELTTRCRDYVSWLAESKARADHVSSRGNTFRANLLPHRIRGQQASFASVRVVPRAIYGLVRERRDCFACQMIHGTCIKQRRSADDRITSG